MCMCVQCTVKEIRPTKIKRQTGKEAARVALCVGTSLCVSIYWWLTSFRIDRKRKEWRRRRKPRTSSSKWIIERGPRIDRIVKKPRPLLLLLKSARLFLHSKSSFKREEKGRKRGKKKYIAVDALKGGGDDDAVDETGQVQRKSNAGPKKLAGVKLVEIECDQMADWFTTSSMMNPPTPLDITP